MGAKACFERDLQVGEWSQWGVDAEVGGVRLQKGGRKSREFTGREERTAVSVDWFRVLG